MIFWKKKRKYWKYWRIIKKIEIDSIDSRIIEKILKNLRSIEFSTNLSEFRSNSDVLKKSNWISCRKVVKLVGEIKLLDWLVSCGSFGVAVKWSEKSQQDVFLQNYVEK